ncbi:MAG: histidine phosphatase family protein [Acidimicrobiia bacterium]|nr:histidine phosphatase family protein [Acidimicrobiia bacterium]
MEIVLVRHAEPEWSREGLSVDNPPLTPRGHEQASLLAKRLAHERFDKVFVSPMVRARQTAEPILEVLGVDDAPIEPWLEELRMPDWTGTPSAEVDDLFERALARPIEEHWDGMAGGERFADFHHRITSGIASTLGPLGVVPHNQAPLWEIADESSRVLFVAHAGTNATIIGHLLGIDPLPWEWERFVMFHASFTVLRPLRIGTGHSFSLLRLGDTEHLPDEMRTR